MEIRELNLQKAKISELPIALDLLKEAAIWLQSKDTSQWSFWLDPPEEKINWIREGFKNKEFFFVFENENLVGMFRLMYFDDMYWGDREDRFDKAAYVHSLTVKTAYKGQEMGARMLRKIEKMLVGRGIHKFRLDCMQSNKGLCQYYENQGFVKIGEVKMSWAMQNLYEKKI